MYIYNVDHVGCLGGQVKHFTMYQPDTDKWKLTTIATKLSDNPKVFLLLVITKEEVMES